MARTKLSAIRRNAGLDLVAPAADSDAAREAQAEQAIAKQVQERLQQAPMEMPSPQSLSRTAAVQLAWKNMNEQWALLICRAFPHATRSQRVETSCQLQSLQKCSDACFSSQSQSSNAAVLREQLEVWPHVPVDACAPFLHAVMPSLLALLGEAIDAAIAEQVEGCGLEDTQQRHPEPLESQRVDNLLRLTRRIIVRACTPDVESPPRFKPREVSTVPPPLPAAASAPVPAVKGKRTPAKAAAAAAAVAPSMPAPTLEDILLSPAESDAIELQRHLEAKQRSEAGFAALKPFLCEIFTAVLQALRLVSPARSTYPSMEAQKFFRTVLRIPLVQRWIQEGSAPVQSILQSAAHLTLLWMTDAHYTSRDEITSYEEEQALLARGEKLKPRYPGHIPMPQKDPRIEFYHRDQESPPSLNQGARLLGALVECTQDQDGLDSNKIAALVLERYTTVLRRATTCHGDIDADFDRGTRAALRGMEVLVSCAPALMTSERIRELVGFMSALMKDGNVRHVPYTQREVSRLLQHLAQHVPSRLLQPSLQDMHGMLMAAAKGSCLADDLAIELLQAAPSVYALMPGAVAGEAVPPVAAMVSLLLDRIEWMLFAHSSRNVQMVLTEAKYEQLINLFQNIEKLCTDKLIIEAGSLASLGVRIGKLLLAVVRTSVSSASWEMRGAVSVHLLPALFQLLKPDELLHFAPMMHTLLLANMQREERDKQGTLSAPVRLLREHSFHSWTLLVTHMREQFAPAAADCIAAIEAQLQPTYWKRHLTAAQEAAAAKKAAVREARRAAKLAAAAAADADGDVDMADAEDGDEEKDGGEEDDEKDEDAGDESKEDGEGDSSSGSDADDTGGEDNDGDNSDDDQEAEDPVAAAENASDDDELSAPHTEAEFASYHHNQEWVIRLYTALATHMPGRIKKVHDQRLSAALWLWTKKHAVSVADMSQCILELMCAINGINTAIPPSAASSAASSAAQHFVDVKLLPAWDRLNIASFRDSLLESMDVSSEERCVDQWRMWFRLLRMYGTDVLALSKVQAWKDIKRAAKAAPPPSKGKKGKARLTAKPARGRGRGKAAAAAAADEDDSDEEDDDPIAAHAAFTLRVRHRVIFLLRTLLPVFERSPSASDGRRQGHTDLLSLHDEEEHADTEELRVVKSAWNAARGTTDEIKEKPSAAKRGQGKGAAKESEPTPTKPLYRFVRPALLRARLLRHQDAPARYEHDWRCNGENECVAAHGEDMLATACDVLAALLDGGGVGASLVRDMLHGVEENGEKQVRGSLWSLLTESVSFESGALVRTLDAPAPFFRAPLASLCASVHRSLAEADPHWPAKPGQDSLVEQAQQLLVRFLLPAEQQPSSRDHLHVTAAAVKAVALCWSHTPLPPSVKAPLSSASALALTVVNAYRQQRNMKPLSGATSAPKLDAADPLPEQFAVAQDLLAASAAVLR